MEIITTRTSSNQWIADDYPGFECKVIADSISPSMKRIVTYAVRFPRFILAEVNTHRCFSRNSASSRAIPLKTFLKMVQEQPYIPIFWGKNQKGMQSGAELSTSEKMVATKVWLQTRDFLCAQCEKLGSDAVYVNENGDLLLETSDGTRWCDRNGLIYNEDERYQLNVHKETVNRLLEPFMWHTALITSTEWANFFALRTHPKSSPAFRIIACLMADAYKEHNPKSLEVDEWHLPYADDASTWNEAIAYGSSQCTKTPSVAYVNEIKLKISAGRCARLSYLTQEGIRAVEHDIRLHDDLVLRQGDPSLDPAHGSPLEHQAQAMAYPHFKSGNFDGWRQYRKMIAHENITQFEWKGFLIGYSPTHKEGPIDMEPSFWVANDKEGPKIDG